MSDEDVLLENDPEAYERAAGRLTAPPDDEVWVVEKKTAEEWHVAAVFTSYGDATAYIQDARDFAENCPEGSDESLTRTSIMLRRGGRRSPTKLYDSWPPEVSDDE